MAECSFLNYSVLVLVAQLCLTLCNPMDCSLLGSSVHGILQVRILEWLAIPFSMASSQPSDRTQVSSIAGRFFTNKPSQKPLISSRNLLYNNVPVINRTPGSGSISHSVMSDSVRPGTVACQAPLSMEFSRQEYWSG